MTKTSNLSLLLLCALLAATVAAYGQQASAPKDVLKMNFNEDGSHFFQATLLNQSWVRWNESNPGTSVEGEAKPQTLDIGLRRTRIQLFGQLNDKVFLYFQFGQNNFNSQFATNPVGNRKNATFFHDAICEYKVTKDRSLNIGSGLTILNGLSRFSQPGVANIMTLDVPVFAQATVDQTDEFSRKLTLYARGQVGKHIDYRVALSDPFPVISNGQAAPALGANSTFTTSGHTKQYQGYVMWQFFEQEQHVTPYMTGTYLGKKKIFNIAGGIIQQPKAMWHKEGSDTVKTNMRLWCIESFLDMPINKEKGTAISAYAGYFNYNFGPNYLRYNGLMNPANGFTATGASTAIAPNAYGNAYPMFGTGNIVYSQVGYLMPKTLLGEKHGQLMPYASLMHANYERLQNHSMDVFDLGVNWLIQGHRAKVSLDYQNHPTYSLNGTAINAGDRKSSVTVQCQIFI